MLVRFLACLAGLLCIAAVAAAGETSSPPSYPAALIAPGTPVPAGSKGDGNTLGERWIHPSCKPGPTFQRGYIVRLASGRLLAVEKNRTITSDDEGQSWQRQGKMVDGPGPGLPDYGTMVRTRDGVIVLVYADLANLKVDWDYVRGEPGPDLQLHLWSIRSVDDGKTWKNRQRIHDGYCEAAISMIETADGYLVAPGSVYTSRPGRAVAFSLVSADQGVTWRKSNSIDLGGHGDHDGGFEETVVDLADGRVMMILRTSFGRFWEAYSDDHGYSWRDVRPSKLDASSSPGFLLRLASGRIALFWNRYRPERDATYFKRAWPFTDRQASWHRAELSMAFSEDEGRSWSKPVVLARQPGAELSYPFVLEHKPGKLWVFLNRTLPPPDLTMSLDERDFVAPARGPAKKPD